MTGPLAIRSKDIKGNSVDLSSTRARLLLLVNVASKCGLTPRTKLWKVVREVREEGFRDHRHPANEFGKQERGHERGDRKFCKSKYSVTFPMMAKVVVKGDGIDPLYEYLTKESKFKGEITWNFEKFLVGKDGNVVARFAPRVKPDDAKVTEAIETELKK